MTKEIAVRTPDEIDTVELEKKFQLGEEFEVILINTTYYRLFDIVTGQMISKVEQFREKAIKQYGYWCGISVDNERQTRTYFFNLTGSMLLEMGNHIPAMKDIEGHPGEERLARQHYGDKVVDDYLQDQKDRRNGTGKYSPWPELDEF